MTSPTRRTVLAGGLAAGAALATSTPAEAGETNDAGDPILQVIAGTGTGFSTYDPPLIGAEQDVALRSETTFVPALACVDVPGRTLVGDTVTGRIRGGCTGPISDHDLGGVLKWSDGSSSAYTIDTVTATRIDGNLVLHAAGTIQSGHYTGAQVNRFESRLSDVLSSPCLLGVPIPGTTGSVVFTVTLP